jgi:uncharacterized NAD(P)/FAD-binding protein YdhS
MIELDVAIVGGGFSGCAVAAQLARHAPPSFSLALFEPDELGRGAAYGTRHSEHLLNTRAHQMSLYPDDPEHFVRWLGVRAGRKDFVSRRLYGEYVGDVAGRTFARARFAVVEDRVGSVRRSERGGFVVESALGRRFEARSVVLATGNPSPNDRFLPSEVLQHSGYVGDPWRFDYRVVDGHVLVIGSGLTALDALVAMETSGYRGVVHMLSRHGRFPELHADGVSYDVIPALDTHSARTVLRSFRRHVEQAQQRGFDWRSVVDAVRPEAEAMWRRLSPVEQQRFERHLRAHWERHRHRAPQEVEAVRRRLERRGSLISYAGRLAEMRLGTVTIATRGGEAVALRPDWIVNCSGVGGARTMAKNPLLRAMRTDGLLQPDSRGVGLRVERDLAAIGAAGRRIEGLWVVGPPVRGSRFEATAVPELSAMAEQVALRVVQAARPEGQLA